MRNMTKIASAIVIALSITACSENKTPEQYLAQANIYISENNSDAAIVELKNGIQQSPQDPELRFILGLAYIDEGSYVNAEKELERAKELGSEDVIVKLGLVKMKLGKVEDLFQLLEHSQNLTDSEYSQLLVYAGITSLQINDLLMAQDYFSQSLAIGGEPENILLAKAYLAQTKGKYQEALELINQVSESAADHDEALLLKGNLYYALKEYHRAAEVFSRYAALVPKAVFVKYFEIKSLIKAEEYQKAEVLVENLLSFSDIAPLANQYKSQLEYIKGNYQAAKNTAEKALQSGASLPISRMLAGVSAYHLKDYEQAYSHLRNIEKYLSNNNPIRQILAVVRLELGYTNEVASSLKNTTGASSELLTGISIDLATHGDLVSALNVLNQAESMDPENVKLKVVRGALMLREGDDSGTDILEEVIELAPELEEVQTSLALEYLEVGDTEKAKKIADNKIKSNDNKVDGYLLLGMYYAKKDESESAINAFEQALRFDPNSAAAAFNLGVYAQKNEDIKRAISLYQLAISSAPGHRDAIRHYVNAEYLNKTLVAAISYLEQLVGKYENTEHINNNLANAYFLNGQKDKAIELLAKAITEKKSIKENFILLGDMYLKELKVDQASQIYRKGLKLYDNDLMLTLRLIGSYEVDKKYELAAKTVEPLLAIYNESAIINILYSQMNYLAGNYEKAKRALVLLNEAETDHHIVNALNGHFFLLEKNYQEAAKNYKLAYDKQPNKDNSLSLARSLALTGNKKQAALIMEHYLSINEDNVMKSLLAELYGQFDSLKSIEIYKELLELAPESPVLLNNLAWQLHLVKQNQQAMFYASKAVKIVPNNESIKDTYDKIFQSLQ